MRSESVRDLKKIIVIPAKAGIQHRTSNLDPGLRRDDERSSWSSQADKAVARHLSHTSQGKQVHTRGNSTYLLPTITMPSLESAFGFAGARAGAAEEGADPSRGVGFHFENGAMSALSSTYQSLLAASQRAPSCLAASFSAKGTFKLNLMVCLG
ncbi:MAG: hypothetical protein JWL63_10 [Rhodocyclales bacterium]|nr:hypothetical protein [Rhodocyclales bacterium]